MNREGEDHITFVDESLFLSYTKSTWWIDSGATIHVANLCRGLLRGGPFEEEKEALESQTVLKLK
jgi:hypothetical protein